MAITITRTDWIDDDGSGTTGTVLNNAVKTDLYNQIDAALAKAAQLTGGNTFTGNQGITGILSVAASGSFVTAATGAVSLVVQNTAAGAGNYAIVNVLNDAGSGLTMYALSTTWTTGADALANGSLIRATGPGGLSLSAIHASGALRFYSGGQAERMRIAPTGEVCINALSNAVGSSFLTVAGNGSLHGIAVQNTNPANVMNFYYCFNSAGSPCGGIIQSGATSVTFPTTSDARLKDDDGRATDLSALRAVVVHDFTWKADGIRDRGVFAQEAHDLFPRAVSKGTDERTDSGDLKSPWMTDYSKFVADLIVGWQQHDAEITRLRAVLATLERMN